MLMIRNEQMEVLSRYMVRQFIKKMLGRLRRDYATTVAGRSDEALEKLVEQAIETGRQYGLEMEWEVEKLLEVMMVLGEDFETDPKAGWVKEILKNETVSTTNRFNDIFDRLENL